MRRSLTKEEILRKRADIKAVFSSGSQVSCPGAKMMYKKNGLDKKRVLFTLRRKFGGSVLRNRTKRISREIYRKMKCDLKPGFDCVIILYPGEYGYYERKTQFSCLFRRADLLRR
jgi:ribonuclease P protein component